MVVFTCTDGQRFVPNDQIRCSSALSSLCEKTGVPDELPLPFSVVSIRNIFRLAEALPGDDRVFAILRECGYEILNACDYLDVDSVLNWLLRGLAIQVGQTWTWAIEWRDVARCVLNQNLATRLFAEYPNYIPLVCALLDDAPFGNEIVEQNAGKFGLDHKGLPQIGSSWTSRARSALASRCYVCLSPTEESTAAPWFSPFATKMCTRHFRWREEVPRLHQAIMDRFASKVNTKGMRGVCENPDVYLKDLSWQNRLGCRHLSSISKLHASMTMTTAVADYVREQHTDDTLKSSGSSREKRKKLDDDASRLARLLDEFPDAPVYNPLLQSYIHTGAFAHSEDNLHDFVQNVKVQIWLDTVQAELSGQLTPTQGISWHLQRLPENHLISDAVKRSAALYISTWKESEEMARAVVGESDAMFRRAREIELWAHLDALKLECRNFKMSRQYVAGKLKPPMTSAEVSERMAQLHWLLEYTEYAYWIDEEFKELARQGDGYDDSGSDSENSESDDSGGFDSDDDSDCVERLRDLIRRGGLGTDRQKISDDVEDDIIQEHGGFPKVWPWLR